MYSVYSDNSPLSLSLGRRHQSHRMYSRNKTKLWLFFSFLVYAKGHVCFCLFVCEALAFYANKKKTVELN